MLSPPVRLLLLCTEEEEEEALTGVGVGVGAVRVTRQVSLSAVENAFNTASETFEKEGSLLGEGSLGGDRGREW